MGKVFRPSTRESNIIQKIESQKERSRRIAISSLRDHAEPLANGVATKLIEKNIVETKNKNGLEEQILSCLKQLSKADEFDVDYKLAPFRSIVANPHVVSLYLTAFVIENVTTHKDTVDVYGSDEEIYSTIHKEVKKHLP